MPPAVRAYISSRLRRKGAKVAVGFKGEGGMAERARGEGSGGVSIGKTEGAGHHGVGWSTRRAYFGRRLSSARLEKCLRRELGRRTGGEARVIWCGRETDLEHQ